MRSQKGAVLIVVLWVLVAMSLLALSFSAAIRTEVSATKNVVDQKQSYYFARAGIEYAVYRILEAQMTFFQVQQQQEQGPGAIPEVLTGFLQLELANGGADVEIIDETGKINLNTAPPHLIYNLLIMVGVDPGLADVITDSVEDWRDPDELHRANGAENDYYQALPHPYPAKNGPFDLPEELLLVRGVTAEIYYGRKGLTDAGERVEYYGLQKYFTAFTRTVQINVNSAPLPVLAAVPGLDHATAARIVELRQAQPLMNPSEIMERLPGIPTDTLAYLTAARSQVYTLISDGHVSESRVVNRIRAVVQTGLAGKGYAVLYWNESNLEL